jgi:DNA-binding CsgD family transcriptional regulator
MLLSRSLKDLGLMLEEGLRLLAGCSAGSLWVLQVEGEMQCVHAWGSGGETVHMLTSGTRIIGRAELPPEAALTDSERQIAQEMLAWASIAMDRIQGGARRSEPREIQAAYTDGLALTARQRQVLFLLVQGLSDKEIALAIGTSPKTIGHQVGILLRKGGVTCRTALANQCLTSPA